MKNSAELISHVYDTLIEINEDNFTLDDSIAQNDSVIETLQAINAWNAESEKREAQRMLGMNAIMKQVETYANAKTREVHVSSAEWMNRRMISLGTFEKLERQINQLIED